MPGFIRIISGKIKTRLVRNDDIHSDSRPGLLSGLMTTARNTLVAAVNEVLQFAASITFISLPDTPSTYQNKKLLRVNDTGNAVTYCMLQEDETGQLKSTFFIGSGLRFLFVDAAGSVQDQETLYYRSPGRIGIGIAVPDAKLHVSDGAILATGTGAGTPVSGAGVRFMWIPDKRAFRSGETGSDGIGYSDGSEWDADNVGPHSFAYGFSCKASGAYSFAGGDRAGAYGNWSFAYGWVARAHGNHCTAINGSAAGTNAVGINGYADGVGAVGIGGAYATGNRAVGIGDMVSINTPYGYVTCVGHDIQSGGNFAHSFGQRIHNNGTRTVLVGDNLFVEPIDAEHPIEYAYAFGRNIRVTASGAMVIGSGVGDTAPTELRNEEPDTLYIGMKSNQPTLIVSPAVGWTGSGKVTIGSTTAGNEILNVKGNIAIMEAGKGLKIAEGTNAKMGVGTLVAGQATISTSAVAANSRIAVFPQEGGTLAGSIRPVSRIAGTSFTVQSTVNTDTANFFWMIVDPA